VSHEERAGEALPRTPLFALLAAIERDVTVPAIDRIWIFPPRRLADSETAVVVVAAAIDSEPDRRRVYAAHYMAVPEAPEARLALDEFGTAPAERVGRMVEDVLERIKDGPPTAPRAVRIGGESARWTELLHSLAEQQLEAALEQPRTPRDPRPRITGRNLRPRGKT
jgi:hypothetical protein